MSFFQQSKTKEKKPQINKKPLKKDWPEEEGELAVDVYETKDSLVVQSTIAGVKSENLNISIENDMLTISGKREKPKDIQEKSYFYQECYWGAFSRRIILPEKVIIPHAEATLKDGVLTLKIPKLHKKDKTDIEIKQID